MLDNRDSNLRSNGKVGDHGARDGDIDEGGGEGVDGKEERLDFGEGECGEEKQGDDEEADGSVLVDGGPARCRRRRRGHGGGWCGGGR